MAEGVWKLHFAADGEIAGRIDQVRCIELGLVKHRERSKPLRALASSHSHRLHHPGNSKYIHDPPKVVGQYLETHFGAHPSECSRRLGKRVHRVLDELMSKSKRRFTSTGMVTPREAIAAACESSFLRFTPPEPAPSSGICFPVGRTLRTRHGPRRPKISASEASPDHMGLHPTGYRQPSASDSQTALPVALQRCRSACLSLPLKWRSRATRIEASKSVSVARCL